jgi:hypothetical protein
MGGINRIIARSVIKYITCLVFNGVMRFYILINIR